jgi:hypothetical protein
MRTRSVTRTEQRGTGWEPVVNRLKNEAASGNRVALTALADLSRQNKYLRGLIGMGGFKNALERGLYNRIRAGSRQALGAALRVLPARTFPRTHRIWSDARRAQRRNNFFNNFGRITHIENTGNNDGGKYITTNKGRWAFYPVAHAHGPHQLFKHNHTNGTWKVYGTGMGPFNLRNGQLVLANRGNNWYPPRRHHQDVFEV